MRRRLLTGTLDGVLILIAAALLVALAGGGKFELFGMISVTIHKFLRPFVALVGVLFLRILVSAPSGRTIGQR